MVVTNNRASGFGPVVIYGYRSALHTIDLLCSAQEWLSIEVHRQANKDRLDKNQVIYLF